MSARARVVLLVAVAAAVAAGIATVGAVATRSDRGGTKPRKGLPLLVLDLGLRTDPAAQALRRGAALYALGKPQQARGVFAAVDDPQARVGESLARWPNGSLAELAGLAEDRPRDPVVLLNLAIARIWAGDDTGGIAELRRVKRVAPDTLSAVRADDLLHPKLAPDLPTFVQTAPFPSDLARLSAPKLFAALERRAKSGRVADLLRYGVALQRLGRPVSAERVYAAAARAAPNDPEARTAAAVGQ